MRIRTVLDRYPPSWLILIGVIALGYGLVRLAQIALSRTIYLVPVASLTAIFIRVIVVWRGWVIRTRRVPNAT